MMIVGICGGIESGSEIGLYYDPMLAKLIVWAPSRPEAIARMHRALLELTIQGVDTSRDFHLRVMEDADSRRGEIGIQWLEQRLPSLLSVAPPESGELAAIIAATLLAERERALRSRPAVNGSAPGHAGATDPWRAAALREGIGGGRE